MKRTIWFVAGIVVSAGLIVAALGFRSVQRTRGFLAEVTKSNKLLEIEIAAVRERLATNANDLEALQAALQETQAQKSSPPSSAQKPAPARRELADLMETRPALRALFKQSSRANLALSYQPFYDAAHLSPEQIDRFEELMTEAEQDKLDLKATAKAQGLAPNDPTLSKMQQQTDENLKTAQKEILGDAAYQELQRYSRQKPLSGFATSFASLLAYNGTPITAPQCRQMLDALSNASSQYQDGGRADLGTIDSSTALKQAELIFTPEQFATFKANLNAIELMKLIEQYFRQKPTSTK